MSRVLICDDRTGRVRRWESILKRRLPGWEVVPLTGSSLADFVTELGEYEQAIRGEGDDAPSLGATASIANGSDLVIIDADLSPARHDLAEVKKELVEDVVSKLRNQSGDIIARQVRSYTEANAIVVVNMFHPRHRNGRVFDLTMMQYVGTAADGHLSDAELDDDEVWEWTEGRVDRFDPWYRDTMLELAQTVERSTQGMKGALDKPVLVTLELDELELLARQLDVFGAVEPASATFRDLAMGRWGVPYPDVQASDDAALERMAASVVRRWLSRMVLPAQNVLVDAPHLLARFPKLATSAQAAVWSAVPEKRSGFEPLPAVSEARARAAEAHLSRPVYHAELARTVQRRIDPLGTPPDDLVFAEDTSRFVARDLTTQFESDVPGNFAPRRVEHLGEGNGDVGYEPFTRLL